MYSCKTKDFSNPKNPLVVIWRYGSLIFLRTHDNKNKFNNSISNHNKNIKFISFNLDSSKNAVYFT
jgi:hypothetical protein